MHMQNAHLIRLSLALIVGLGLLSSAPLQAQDAATAAVTCKDGSSSKGGQGACSHHGGVNKSAAASGEAATGAAASTPTPAAATKAAPAPAASATSAKTSETAADGSAMKSTADSTKSGTPTAKCKDGTMSYSKHHSGSCSHHGGVAQFLDK